MEEGLPSYACMRSSQNLVHTIPTQPVSMFTVHYPSNTVLSPHHFDREHAILLFQFMLLISHFISCLCFSLLVVFSIFSGFTWGCGACLMWEGAGLQTQDVDLLCWQLWAQKLISTPMRGAFLSSKMQPQKPRGGLVIFHHPARKQEGLALV